MKELWLVLHIRIFFVIVLFNRKYINFILYIIYNMYK